MERRSFLIGLASLVAAPSIVHAGNIMPVRSICYFDRLRHMRTLARYADLQTRGLIKSSSIFSDCFVIEPNGLNLNGIPIIDFDMDRVINQMIRVKSNSYKRIVDVDYYNESQYMSFKFQRHLNKVADSIENSDIP